MPDKKRKNLHKNVMNSRALHCADVLKELTNSHVQINKVQKLSQSELIDLVALRQGSADKPN